MTFTVTHNKTPWRNKWFDFQFIKPGVTSHCNPLGAKDRWSFGIRLFGHTFSFFHWDSK